MLQAATVFLWLLTYSFLGWAYESALCSITGKKWVNRGFLNGPVCPVYGFGALLIILCFHQRTDLSILSLFLASAVLTCIVEYFTSWILEKLFHTRWWDYSKYRFQLNGRICLLGAVVFGILSVLLMKVIHPFISQTIQKIPDTGIYILSASLALLFLGDIFVTVSAILHMNHKLDRLQLLINQEKDKYIARLEELKSELQGKNIELKDGLRERGLEMKLSLQEMKEQTALQLESKILNSDYIQKLLSHKNYVERRLLKAFPKMRSLRSSEAFAAWKEKFKKKQ